MLPNELYLCLLLVPAELLVQQTHEMELLHPAEHAQSHQHDNGAKQVMQPPLPTHTHTRTHARTHPHTHTHTHTH